MTPDLTLWQVADLFADTLKSHPELQAAFIDRYGNAPLLRRALHPKALPTPTATQPFLVVSPMEAELGNDNDHWPFKLLVAAAVKDEATEGDESDLTQGGVKFLAHTVAPLLIKALAESGADVWPSKAKMYLDIDTAPLLAVGLEITVNVPHTLGAGVTLGT